MSTLNRAATAHRITIEIDENELHTYSDGFLAAAWHVSQWNPAPFADKRAGGLVERLSREIVRRWLRGVEPEVWKHKGSDYYWENLRKFAKYEPGSKDNLDPAWHEGHWVPRDDHHAAENTSVENTAPLLRQAVDEETA